MTADLISPPFSRRATSWAGRASQHRRDQVHGTCTTGSGSGVHVLWMSLVEVLSSIDRPSSALLCTAQGAPVAAFGLPRTDLPLASRRAGRMFAARAHHLDQAATVPAGAIETYALTSGLRHTVIASVPAPSQGDHLLCVSAEGVSLPLLQAWTRRAAEDLREVLADQDSPSSSSAAV